MNLIAELKELLKGEVNQKAALLVGEKEDKVKLAFDALVSTVIGGIMKRVSNETGATTLMNVIQKGKHDGSILTQVATYVADKESFTAFTDKGHSLVSMLLPDKKSSIATLIAQFAGVRNSSATSLLAFVMPLAIGRLGKVVATQGADKATLANLILEQKSLLISETPETLQLKMLDVLGLGAFMSQEMKPVQFASAAPLKSNVNSHADKHSERVEYPVKYSSKEYDTSRDRDFSIPKWALPAGAIALVLGGLGYFVANYDWSSNESSSELGDTTQFEQVTGAKIDTTALVKDSTALKPDSALIEKSLAIALPNGTTIEALNGSFAQKLTQFLQDSVAQGQPTFVLDNLVFQGNTSSIAPGTEKAVEDLGKIMVAYPRLQVKLVGHTDNAGDTLQSKKLSLKRAFAIRNALLANGVSPIRIDFEGKGPFAPIASNATEEGKTRNRRVEVKVVRK